MTLFRAASGQESCEDIQHDVGCECDQHDVGPVDLQNEGCCGKECDHCHEADSDAVVWRTLLDLEREHRDLADEKKCQDY